MLPRVNLSRDSQRWSKSSQNIRNWSNEKGLSANILLFWISMQIWNARAQRLNWNFGQDLVVANYLNIFR